MISSQNRTPSVTKGRGNTISDSTGLLTLSINEILLTKVYHITPAQGAIAFLEKKKKLPVQRNAKKIISFKSKHVF